MSVTVSRIHSSSRVQGECAGPALLVGGADGHQFEFYFPNISTLLHLNSSCSHLRSPVVTTLLVFCGENLHNVCRRPPRGNNSRAQFPNKQDQLDLTPISPSLLTIPMLITSSPAISSIHTCCCCWTDISDRQKEVNSRTQRDAISELVRED